MNIAIGQTPNFSIPFVEKKPDLGAALRALVTLVVRATLFCFAALLHVVTCSRIRWVASLIQNQRQKSLEAARCFAEAMRGKGDAFVREHQVRYGADDIQRRLEKQRLAAHKQMEREGVNPNFHFLAAPDNFPPAEAIDLDEGYLVGVCSAIGPRPALEDEHLAVSFNLPIGNINYPVRLFGVFDGHGGIGAAEYVKAHLQPKLIATMQAFNPRELTPEGIFNALKLTCVGLSDDFKRLFPEDQSGTTAAIAMILDNKIWCANVGDSRIVLADGDGSAHQLTEDAKPDAPRHRRRIENRGGTVWPTIPPRINRLLATGGAIGDKPVGPGVSARPAVTNWDLPVHGGKLIIACDGIWDVVSTTQAIADVVDAGPLRPAAVARSLAYSALRAGSDDNVTALVVELPPQG